MIEISTYVARNFGVKLSSVEADRIVRFVKSEVSEKDIIDFFSNNVFIDLSSEQVKDIVGIANNHY